MATMDTSILAKIASFPLCRNCFPSNEKLSELTGHFQKLDIGKRYTGEFDETDSNTTANYLEEFETYLITNNILPKSACEELVQLLSALLLPLGSACGYGRSGNSNGKLVLNLLLQLALMNANKYAVVPESLKCGNFIYKIHVSTHSRGQPSEVNAKLPRTQDVLLCVVKKIDDGQHVNLLTTRFPLLPCVVVADADQSKGAKFKENNAVLMYDLNRYRRSFDEVASLGLFFNDKKVYVYLLQPKVNEARFLKTYLLSRFEEMIELICYLNKFLHFAATTVPQDLGITILEMMATNETEIVNKAIKEEERRDLKRKRSTEPVKSCKKQCPSKEMYRREETHTDEETITSGDVEQAASDDD